MGFKAGNGQYIYRFVDLRGVLYVAICRGKMATTLIVVFPSCWKRRVESNLTLVCRRDSKRTDTSGIELWFVNHETPSVSRKKPFQHKFRWVLPNGTRNVHEKWRYVNKTRDRTRSERSGSKDEHVTCRLLANLFKSRQ